MKALLRQIQREQQTRRHQAEVAANLGTMLQKDLSPENVNAAQEWLAGRIRETEDRIRKIHARRSRRKALLLPRLKRKNALRRRMGPHQALLEAREDVLKRRRVMLKLAGDAIAWLVCGNEPRLIYALFDPSKTHHAPTGVAAIGHRIIRRRAHQEGTFLVVENDLTRCLGKGDMTMVPIDEKDPSKVYPMELKTHGEAKIGNDAYTHVHFMLADEDPVDKANVEEFAHAVGLNRVIDDAPSDIVLRQREEMSEGRRIAHRLLTRLSTRISSRPPQTNMTSIKAVLDRALQHGTSYDVPEQGVAYASIRVFDTDVDRAVRKVEKEMGRVGLGRTSDTVTIVSTPTLLGSDEASVNVRPMPLWSLPHEHRSLLLSEDLILQVRYDSLVLKEIMEDHGIVTRAVNGKRWEFDLPDGPTVALDLVGMAELTARIMFEGVSPTRFAERLLQEFSGSDSL